MIRFKNHKRKSWLNMTCLTATVSLTLVSMTGCFEPSNPEDQKIASIQNGRVFYMDNCASCHSAGAEDTTSAFLSSNLANKQDRLIFDPNGPVTNLSVYGGSYQLMNQFAELDSVVIEALKNYFTSL